MKIIGTALAALFLVAGGLLSVSPVLAERGIPSATENGTVIPTNTDPTDPTYPAEGALIPEQCTTVGSENGPLTTCTPARVTPRGAVVCVLVGTENGPGEFCTVGR